jgi:hypothetical protein
MTKPFFGFKREAQRGVARVLLAAGHAQRDRGHFDGVRKFSKVDYE